jgi:hypothetical protein
MRSPTFEEISEHVRLLPRFFVAVLSHYFFVGGGAIVGTILVFCPNLYQGVRVSGWWLVFVLSFIAVFLAWAEQYRSVRPIEIRDRLDGLVRRGEALHGKWSNRKRHPRWRTKRWAKATRSFVRHQFTISQIDSFNDSVAGFDDEPGSLVAQMLESLKDLRNEIRD